MSWRIPPDEWLVIETNYGGQRFDICGECAAVVPTDMRSTHEAKCWSVPTATKDTES